jgi:hypothetical protein
MKAKLRQRIKRWLPSRLVAWISAERWWRLGRAIRVQSGLPDFCRRIASSCGLKVRNGPFAGMAVPRECLEAGCNTSALLGTYEAEIHPWLHRLRPNAYQRILDIGAAEGYYAVGMAMLTRSRVDAFDPAFTARRLCRSMARLNSVSHLVLVHSWCTPETLLQLRGLRCFILCDCEGYEVSLFAGGVIDALANSDLIIELHDGPAGPGATRDLLTARFNKTHKIQVVRFRPRNLADFPEPALAESLGADAIRAISEEGRPLDQEWMFATPIS